MTRSFSDSRAGFGCAASKADTSGSVSGLPSMAAVPKIERVIKSSFSFTAQAGRIGSVPNVMFQTVAAIVRSCTCPSS